MISSFCIMSNGSPDGHYQGPDRGRRHEPIDTLSGGARTSDATDLPESTRAHQTLRNSDGDARA